MATLRKYGGKYNSTFCQLCGLSTDTKPTSVLINDRSVGLADGSEFIEMDTNKKYRYSADNATWYEVERGGGGGGSATLIDKTITANGTYDAVNDGADGYKSVDVEVTSEPNFDAVEVFMCSMGYTESATMYILRSSDGIYNLDELGYAIKERYYTYVTFADPVRKIIAPSYQQTTIFMCFTPATDYDGVYNYNGTKRSASGDTISAGDRLTYSYELNTGSTDRAKQFYRDTFKFNIS